MKAVDTNSLVQFLVNDDERQAAVVHRLLHRHETLQEPLSVPVLVVLELLRAGQSGYGFF